MFISKVVLHKCKRFHLKGIETLEVNPESKTQIVLGTNGSGKSSLLKIGFTVMPAEARDFLKGGYKEIHVSHKGNHYILKNDFGGRAPTHSFMCNGEQLNEGLTAAVHRELTREHFGMTIDIHRVLTGQLRFTSMSSIQRREWITLLSSADFEYVIRLHGKVRKAARDKGVLSKHLSERIVSETSRKLSGEALNGMREKSDRLVADLLALHQNSKRSDISSDFNTYVREYSSLHAELEEGIAKARAIKVQVPEAIGSTDIDDVIRLRDNIRSRGQALEAALQEISERHSEVDVKLHQMSELGDLTQDDLLKAIGEVNDRIAKAKKKYKTNCNHDRLPMNRNVIGKINQLVETLHAIPANSVIDPESIYALQQERTELQNRYTSGISRISELEYRLNHISNCSTISCPECGHSFKDGVNPDEESSLSKELNKGLRFKKDMEARISAAGDKVAEVQAIHRTISELANMRDSSPELSELWSLIKEAGGFKMGRELAGLCRDVVHDIDLRISIDLMEAELAPIQEKLQILVNAAGSGGLREIANSLSSRVIELKTSIMENKEMLKEVEQFYAKLIAANDISNNLDIIRTRIDDLMDKILGYVSLEEINSRIRDYQSQVAVLDQAISEAKVQMGIIADLNKSLEETLREEKALIAVEKALSPKDGLIAEQIMVFINTFIARINEVIAKVWGYNLALDSCNLEDGELDYKFPMYVHSNDNVIPDIEFGSDSQVDIVNQAFRLVVYDFLELDEFPLYLDELGRTFDEVHRLNLTLALKDILDDERYSQVFLISHLFESQNSFPNSQIVVLDDSHLSIRRVYNEHVIIS